MAQTDLEQIESYWSKKYPLIDIKLWSNEYGTKFFGNMIKNDGNEIFEADTIGELISLGEQFLRKVN